MTAPPPPDDRTAPNRVMALAQTVVGLLVPLPILRLIRGRFSGPRAGRGLTPVVIVFLAAVWVLLFAAQAAAFAFLGFPTYGDGPPKFENPPKFDVINVQTAFGFFFRGLMGVIQLLIQTTLLTDWLFWRSFPDVPDRLRPFRQGLRTRVALQRGFYRFVGTLFVIGFSLLPLTALLAALPAAAPDEAVLSDTVRPATTRWARFRRRALAVVAGLVVLIALFAFAIELTSRLPLPAGGQLASLAKKVLGTSAVELPFFRDSKRLEEDLALKPLLDRYDEAKQALINPELPPVPRKEWQAKLAAVNHELTEWADAADKAWVVTPSLLEKWRKTRAAAEEEEIADEVVVAARQQLAADDLLKRRKTLEQSANRANQSSYDRAETLGRLDRVNAEIEDRKASSVKLRVMLDPQLAPWLAEPLWKLLPPALVQHWPFVFLIVYAADLALLLCIGRVPLAYNLRYLWVRRRDTILTALAFTVVVALVIVLLAFVNGMYKLNEGTGVPGNVLVLSEGSTDELFSNLERGGGVDQVERVAIVKDENGRPFPKPLTVARGVVLPDGKLVPLKPTAPLSTPGAVYLASFETYMVMNQPIPPKPGEKPRRRFLQLRAMKSAPVAAAVHNMDLFPGGHWFDDTGVERKGDSKTYLQAVLGEGAAATLGADAGKPRLDPGDTFNLGDMDWVVTGVMKSQGTTFGSEIWVSMNNAVVQSSGKGNKFTTLVVRMADDTDAAARATAEHLNKEFTLAKLKAFPEPEYYKELTKTNEQFLTWIVFVAVVMAVGGVFGVMNTMFASIAARIKEVGVLRILGFKRWQILISFMLESLAIAFAGGLLGCMLGYLANGFEASSTMSGGGGGGKSVALKMIVDYQTIAAGMLFTLVMGRLGGLVPALSAMRMEILDSLR
jgi:ABC-type lipoprotein release transport system permease subunit